jgi:hypothetical protein
MPFIAPIFEEAAESEIIDKLMALVHRDMKLALDYFYAAEDLADLAAMVRGDVSVFQYPLLVLGIERMSSSETVSGEWLDQDLTVGAGLVVKDLSVAAVKAKAEKYVRAFKAVIRGGILELLPDQDDLMEYTLDIDHRYFRHGTKGAEFTQPVEFAIRIRFGEK